MASAARASEPAAPLSRRARVVRALAVGYLIKTLLVGIAWLAVPDLPARAADTARAVWERILD